MSSYLERLATSARTASTRIAPLVRPLYLAPPISPEPPGSSLERPDDERLARAPQPADEPMHVSRSPRLHLGGLHSPAPPDFAPLLPELRPPDVSAPPPAEGDHPALSSPPARPAAVRAASAAPGETPEPGRTSSPASRPGPVIAERGPRLARDRGEDLVTSLVPRAPRGATAPRIADPRPAYTPPRTFGANQRARRGGDEIQIHIGRVEVVALAPPQPQPAPPPRERRALRLDDYLRSGG